MVFFPNVDPTFIHKRDGTEDDPYIPVSDSNNIRNNAVVMKEIPHFETGVKATVGSNELEEVKDVAPSNENEFRVDYTTGVAYFHDSLNSKLVTLEYLGIGYVSIPASRVWIVGESGDPTETLEQALDRVDEGVQVLDSMSDFKFQGDFQEDSSYDKWNFVFYKNKTFVAIEDSSGEKPDESNKWRLVSSGVGFAGVYQEDKTYDVGDIVSDPQSKNIFFSKKSSNDDGLDSEDGWELMLTLDDIVSIIDNKLEEMNSFLQQISEAEEQREQNEQLRQEVFDELLLDTESIGDIIQAEEETRIINENERVSNETARKSSEIEREEQEDVRKSNEEGRVLAEATRTTVFEEMDEEFQNKVEEAVVSLENVNQDFESIKTIVEETLDNIEVSTDQIEEELGRVSNFTYIGEFDLELNYFKGNLVSYGGSIYIAVQDSQGHEVTDEEYWDVFVEKGADISEFTIDGVSPDEEGNISLEELDIVRNIDFQDRATLVDEQIGEMGALNTLHKDSLVGAINELKKRIDDIVAVLE